MTLSIPSWKLSSCGVNSMLVVDSTNSVMNSGGTLDSFASSASSTGASFGAVGGFTDDPFRCSLKRNKKCLKNIAEQSWFKKILLQDVSMRWYEFSS